MDLVIRAIVGGQLEWRRYELLRQGNDLSDSLTSHTRAFTSTGDSIKLLQGNEIWGLGNGYYSSQSDNVTQSPKSLVSHRPFYSKADRTLLGAPVKVR